MLKLFKNATVYDPKHLGKKDVLITADKIASIQDSIAIETNADIEIIDLEGKLVFPGFIDSHVHICGAGGEGGYQNRTPEIMLTDLTKAGITTVVGCIGTDSVTRTMSNLIAKARGLQKEGITCYAYTGSYQIPVKTLTGSIQDDIVLIDLILGVGEVALSDHRSSEPTFEELIKVVASARVGGLLSGKAGIVNVHIGTGQRMLEFLERIADETEIPITQCLPTHVNRSKELLEAGIKYAKRNGLVDLTTSTKPGQNNNKVIKCSSGARQLIDAGVSVENISFSSDAQGSLPVFDDEGKYLGLTVGSADTLFNEMRDAVIQEKIPIETALKFITSNPARNLNLNKKGVIQHGKDADLVIVNDKLEIDSVLAMGKFMIRNKQIMKKGTFEN